jgi:hypothetical protein
MSGVEAAMRIFVTTPLTRNIDQIKSSGRNEGRTSAWVKLQRRLSGFHARLTVGAASQIMNESRVTSRRLTPGTLNPSSIPLGLNRRLSMALSRTLQSTKHCSRLSTALSVVSWLIVAGAASGRACSALWQAPPRPQAPQSVEVDYRRTQRKYVAVKRGDMNVWIEKQLKDETPDVVSRALDRLRAKRTEALAVLPKRARDRLVKVPFFLMYGPKAEGGGRNNGLDYFQKNAPDFHQKLDRRWRDAIVVYCAQNYLDITDLWARKALFHEFAHAYQLEQWPEKQPDILRAWENARNKDLYRDVLDVETKNRLERAYALTNQLEYFAELSCMYFVGCNYEPSGRNQLKDYDPVGYKMIRKMWITP